MAGQSEIQTLIQSLAGTQSLAQSNTPSWVQNGNPNTVYNQTPPEGGYVPPRADAFDNWTINKPDPNAVPKTDWSSLVKEVQGPLKVQWDMSTSVPNLPQIGQPQQPGTPQAPQQNQGPVTLPEYGWAYKRGGVPGLNYGVYDADPKYRLAWDTAAAEHRAKEGHEYNKWTPMDSVINRVKELYTQYATEERNGTRTFNNPSQSGGTGVGPAGYERPERANPITGGTGGGGDFKGVGNGAYGVGGAVRGGDGWKFQGNVGSATDINLTSLPDNIQQALGINANGTMSWEQMADFFLPGNVYLSQTGQWDASNFVAALLGEVSGLPVNTLMNKLGEWQAGQDDPQNWLEEQLIDHWLDNLQNRLQGKLNIGQQAFQIVLKPAMTKAIANSVNMAGIKMQDKAVSDLLEQANEKMEQKIQEKSATAGRDGGGGGGEGRGGNRAGSGGSAGGWSGINSGGASGGRKGTGRVDVGPAVKAT